MNILLLCAAGWAVCQDDVRVPDAGGAPDRLLYRYLQKECHEHFETRREAVAKLKTAQDLRWRQERLRAKFLKAIGGFRIGLR